MWTTRLRCPSEAAYPQLTLRPWVCRCRRATGPSASGCLWLGEGDGNCRTRSRLRCPRLAAVGIGFQMHLLIFDRTPQPLDEDVVHETPAPVHGNRDAGGLEFARERGAG